MKMQNVLWGALGFGTAMLAVTGLVLILPIDGQDEENDQGDLYSTTTGSAFYIRIDGIEGECSESSHDGWCEIGSFSQSLVVTRVNATSSGRTRGMDRAEIQTFTIVKEVDKATPKLLEACVNGEEIEEVEIDFCSAGPDGARSYMKYVLSNVVIQSYRTGGTTDPDALESEELNFIESEEEPDVSQLDFSKDNNIRELEQYVPYKLVKPVDRPTEIFTFSFEEIKVVYTEMDEEGESKGNIEYSWKVEEGEEA